MYMNNSNMSLEPRLVEYLKKKKFYEENNINTDANCMEKQYQITRNDLDKINKFMNTKEVYTQKSVKNYDEDSDLINPTKSKFKMTNMYDYRLDRINEKVKKEKEANKYRFNTSNLQKNYDMYSRNFSSTTSRDFSNEFNLDNIIEDMNKPIRQQYDANPNTNTYELVSPPSVHQYSNPPVIHRDQRLPYQQINNSILGNGYSKSYNVTETPYVQKSNVFDTVNKMTIPSNNCRKSDLNVSYGNFSTNNMKNIDYENYMKYGNPTSKARSLGFENASEHFFQFIDKDIQDPKHVVSDRAIPTRLDNKTVARSKNRDVM